MTAFHLDPVSFYCKDSRDMSELSDETVDLVIADSPYGRNYISRHRVITNTIAQPIVGDKSFDSELYRTVLKECHRVMKDNTAIYVFTDWHVLAQVIEVLEDYFKVRSCIVWDKQNWTGGDLEGAYAHTYEMLLYAVKGNPKLRCEGRPRDLISVPRVAGNGLIHPMQKPTPLLAKLIRNSSDEGDLVLDPFAGVASTLEAARLNGRRAIGFEVELLWYTKGVARLRQMVFAEARQTGEVASLSCDAPCDDTGHTEQLHFSHQPLLAKANSLSLP